MHASTHAAPHEQAALRVHVVAERQLGEVAAIERDDHTAQETPEDDAAVALVGREAVGLALRVVEFLLPRLHVYVGVSQLAEINLRARHDETAHRALDRHIAQKQRRQPFRREPVDGVHRDAIAVGIDELLVDPVAAALRELLDV